MRKKTIEKLLAEAEPGQYELPCPYPPCQGKVTVEFPACAEPGYRAACNMCGGAIVAEGPGYNDGPVVQATPKGKPS